MCRVEDEFEDEDEDEEEEEESSWHAERIGNNSQKRQGIHGTADEATAVAVWASRSRALSGP